MRYLTIVCFIGLNSLMLEPEISVACPFCSAVSQTFAEEMASMDAVVIADLQSGPVALPEPGEIVNELPPSVFSIQEIIKGQEFVKINEEVRTHYFGATDDDVVYLIMGADPNGLMWSSPLPLEDRAREYIKAVAKLPVGHERLEFFQKHLEDEDEMLARDAYDEFAKMPYEGVIALRDKMDHDQLLVWIQSPETPASRRRLYFTMLGVSGSVEDLPLLEGLLTAEKRESRLGLDALIACYLSLAGEGGLSLIDREFLANDGAEYSDTYSAIMAIRFHGNETDVIPRKRLVQSLRLVLQRQQLADLVIPDLARWEDWSVIEDLVTLFKDADKESNWVRVPIINYMRACPEPEAAKAMKQLEEIDSEAVKRANIFFPFAQFSGGSRDGEASDEKSDEATEKTDAGQGTTTQEVAQPIPPPDNPAGER